MKSFLTSLSVLLCLTVGLPAEAKRKQGARRPLPSPVRCDSASFMYMKGGVRLIGHVYEFYLSTSVPNIILDSVWFGATPVPCDVYALPEGLPVDTAKKAGRYLLKVNRDLYRNFPDMTDSTEAFRRFRPPFVFKGDAMLMYRYKGKRYFLPVYHIEQRYDKLLRQ